MSKTDRNQQALKWLEKEQQKDRLEIKSSRDKLVKEIRGLNKDDMFKKEEPVEKVTIWQKIKRMIWGN